MKNNKRHIILGTETIRDIKRGQSSLHEKYRERAEELGYHSQVRMKREGGKLIFYVIVEK